MQSPVKRCLPQPGKPAKPLQQLGIERPHLAVAGLNPHCGEDGLFGDEEQRAIKPAVISAQKEGLYVTALSGRLGVLSGSGRTI